MSTLLIGISPEHRVALLLGLLLPALVLPAWRAIGAQAALGSPWAGQGLPKAAKTSSCNSALGLEKQQKTTRVR